LEDIAARALERDEEAGILNIQIAELVIDFTLVKEPEANEDSQTRIQSK